MQRENAEEDEAKSQMKNIRTRGWRINMRGADQANASSREGSRTSSDPVRCCCMSAAPLNRAREKRRCNHTSPVGLKKSTAERGKTFRNCSIPANVNEELLE